MSTKHRAHRFAGPPKLEYLLDLPRGYDDADASWPFVLFLHGAGERGGPLERVAGHGIPKVIARGHGDPFIAVSPHCPVGTWWVEITSALHRLVDELSQAYRVDASRIYLTGLSMGGFGVWKMAAERPDRYAAVAPVCGGGRPSWAPRLANMPTWVFHGDADDIVPIEHSLEMVAALEAVGAPVRFTRYPNVKHDSWTRTYDDPALYSWLLEQHREAS